MKLKRSFIILFFLGALALLIAACDSGDEPTEADGSGESEETEGGQTGGTLNIALNAQPPTFDPVMTTSTATRDTARMVFESLLVLNAEYEATPLLAEEVENENNQTFTFHLREGIMFHDGEEMIAEDVVASMNRWKENANQASEIIGNNEFEEVDEYTVSLELDEPSSMIMSTMANAGQFGAIMPKEIVEAAGPDGVTEYIGTGPYEFVEWAQDNYIHVSKFEDYQPLEEEPDGLAGARTAPVDDIYFYIAPDSSTRLAGIQSGEYDLAYQLPFDSYQQLMETDLQVEPSLAGDMVMQYNSSEGLFSDPTMRQAVNAALNLDEILQASLVDPEIYTMGANLMEDENVQWATDAGEEYYNQNDQDLAQQLLDEAGYDGEEVKIVTTRDYQHYYDSSVVIQEQLENLGMNVSLEVYDWPSLTDLVDDESAWHLRVNGYTFRPNPTQMLYIQSDTAGVAQDDQADALMEEIETADTEEEARASWEELQEYIWSDYLPGTKLGRYSHLYVMADYVDGFVYSNGGIFWNISVNN
ncbi:ABC transporter substrate-binding protein [Virgibacillus oceani]